MSKPPKGKTFWDSCPTCGSYKTIIIHESHLAGGYETTRHCEMCHHEWNTKAFDVYHLDDEPMRDPGEYRDSNAYQQGHPERFFNWRDEEDPHLYGDSSGED